jgi:hypothetical protein
MKTSKELKAKQLRKLGINKLLLDNLCQLVRNNQDQLSMLDEEPMLNPVSVELCNASRNPKKLWNALVNAGIYNIIYVNLSPRDYNFTVKLFDGSIENHIINRIDKHMDFKEALINAIICSSETAENKRAEYEIKMKDRNERLKRLTELTGVDANNINIPLGLDIDDEMIASLTNVLTEHKLEKLVHGFEPIDVVDAEFTEINDG